MLSTEYIQSVIQQKIDELNFNRKPAELYEPIKYMLCLGGKRLRPTLCLLACDLFGTDIHEALNPALGIEIFHNFTLMHDDIMDHASIRRGKETVHKKWNQNIAILSGDTMMAIAYELIMKAPGKVQSQVLHVFNQTAIEVCEGQQYDLNFETQHNVSIEDYISMIRLKTAVLIAGSLKIGAVIGGSPTEDSEKLYRFGENIGIAFQLQDDLLDIFSDEVKFGKKNGGDIVTNKKTFLYLKAFELADKKKQDELIHFFSPDFTNFDEKVNGVKAIYQQLDLKNITKAEIKRYHQSAMVYLDDLNVADTSKSELRNVTDKLMNRKY
jgi:geranylgeranyl diphosphate synthase type II